jgi:uncharacterized protein (UPF0248 family)
MPSTEIVEARKIARGWEVEVGEEKVQNTNIQAKFVKRKVILQQDLKPDLPIKNLSKSEGEKPKAETRRTGESFKKIKGSSPAQIRKQFLQHAMGGEASEVQSGKGKSARGKLRPPKDVLNRLNYDGGYNADDYVVGYIDRQAGILEKSVAEWQEYEEQELIAYFKHVPENEIVWDRARKVDWVFNRRLD